MSVFTNHVFWFVLALVALAFAFIGDNHTSAIQATVCLGVSGILYKLGETNG